MKKIEVEEFYAGLDSESVDIEPDTVARLMAEIRALRGELEQFKKDVDAHFGALDKVAFPEFK